MKPNQNITAGYKKEVPSTRYLYLDYSEASFMIRKESNGVGESIHLPLKTCKLTKKSASHIEVSIPDWLYQKHLRFFTK